MDKDSKDVLTQIFSAAVAAADPYIAVKNSLTLAPGLLKAGDVRYSLADIHNIYIVGAGKAAYGMARAAEDVLGALVKEGAVVTKDGHGGRLKQVLVYEASHPVPDLRGLEAGDRMLKIAEGAGEGDLVIALLSGGASSLMVQPLPGISLGDKQEATRLMLSSGADIAEVNCVRKHLSAIKGGRLALAAAPARVLALIISDVPGDDLGVIASGPTAPDETTFIQAAEILKMRGVYDRMPEAVRAALSEGGAGLLPETPKPDDKVFEGVHNVIVGSNRASLSKAAEVAGYMGFAVLTLEAPVTGEAKEVAARLSKDVIAAHETGTPKCLLFGGETTVTVKGAGRGGRNQEMALAFALGVDGARQCSALFAGTDGADGPTDAAGAFVDGETAQRARESGLDPVSFLADNDSNRFFEVLGDLFVTGPTGTNVMDLGIILIR